MIREYRDFNRLDPRLFKAFLAAADCENFTLAAKKAALTQSGVSQQVAKLEEQVGTQLFKRINKAVTLTPAGARLVRYIDIYLDGMDSFFEEVTESEQGLRGRVSYAMPNSCLLSPHLGMLLEKRKSVPGIELDIHIQANEKVYESVLAGDVDFGFVTKKIPNPALHFAPFCQEEFALIAHADFAEEQIDEDYLRNSDFISFPGMDTYFDAWRSHFMPDLSNFTHDFLNIKAFISQLDGVLTFLSGGVGATVLPKHCVHQYLSDGSFVELKPANSQNPCLNDIYIVTLKDLPSSRRCQTVIDWFFAMKAH